MPQVAVDVVVCSSEDLQKLFCTDFYIKFKASADEEAFIELQDCASKYDVIAWYGEDERDEAVLQIAQLEKEECDLPPIQLPKPKYAVPEDLSARIEWIDIYMNCVERCANIIALLAPKSHGGEVLFYDKLEGTFTRNPSSACLRDAFGLHKGCNNMRAVLRSKPEVKLDFSIYVYVPSDKLIVFDIDGTLTISDTRGYFETVVLGYYSYVHDGIVPFMHIIREALGAHIMFLTSRPLVNLEQTRLFLQKVRDPNSGEAIALPTGPLFMNRESITSAAYRELISHTTLEFKAGVLLSIRHLFERAKLDSMTAEGTAERKPKAIPTSPFVAGVGNRHADMQAYAMAGISKDCLFYIDKRSQISIWQSQEVQTWNSYNDPRLLIYIDEICSKLGE
jgi:hypothetical protein